MVTPGTRPKPSARQVLILAFSPSAGLGPLRALGDMLVLVLPGAPRLLNLVALFSWFGLIFLGLALGGLILALWNGAGLALFALAMALAFLAYVVRALALVRLFRTLLAQPLVAALMQSALAPALSKASQSDPNAAL